MLLDNEIQHLDEMIDAYAAIAAYVEHVPELEDKISAAYKQMCSSLPEFDSFNAILGRGYQMQERWTRHVAWVSQHAFSNRAYCVGNKILLRRGGHFVSPLVEQIGLLGFEPSRHQLPDPDRLIGRDVPIATEIDALIVDRTKEVAFLIKGLACERAARSQRKPSAGAPSLFAPIIAQKDRFFVHPRKVTALGLAFNAVRYAYADLQVIPVLLVLDDPSAGSGFQAFDLSYAMSDLDRREPRCLGDYEQLRSSNDLAMSGVDLDDLRYLPKWPSSDPLTKLPADRATRCMIALSIIWNKQRELVDNLAIVKATEIGEHVRDRYFIEYPSDLRRHDLEDCLERGGLIQRPVYEGNAYSLTPRGLARILLLKRLFTGKGEIEDDDDVRTHILRHIHRQAELWARYRSGEAVCV